MSSLSAERFSRHSAFLSRAPYKIPGIYFLNSPKVKEQTQKTLKSIAEKNNSTLEANFTLSIRSALKYEWTWSSCTAKTTRIKENRSASSVRDRNLLPPENHKKTPWSIARSHPPRTVYCLFITSIFPELISVRIYSYSANAKSAHLGILWYDLQLSITI